MSEDYQHQRLWWLDGDFEATVARFAPHDDLRIMTMHGAQLIGFRSITDGDIGEWMGLIPFADGHPPLTQATASLVWTTLEATGTVDRLMPSTAEKAA